MKLKEFLKGFFLGIKSGISRFIVAFVCSILFYLTIAYAIIFETSSEKIIIPLCMTFALVAVLSVFLKIAEEYIMKKLHYIVQYLLCGFSGLVAYLLIREFYESLYMIMAYAGIMIALLCFIFFTLMREENRDKAFPKLVSSFVFTWAICSVVSGGLATCIAAFQSLIFSYDEMYKIYLLVISLVAIVGFVNVFLSFIPKKDVPVQQSKVFRIFVLFTGLPLYILLIGILLVYLAKIVITRNMPVGEINWFASFASLFFIFFLLSVKQYTQKAAKLFVKFGGYFLIPVLIMQAIAVFERIGAYGLTTPRTVSLVLILISVLFIGGSVIAPKHLNKIALASGFIVLLVTVTPLNVIDMPIASQTKILKNTLIANDMLKDGKVIPSDQLSIEDAQKIESAYQYLKYDAKSVPDFIPNSEKSLAEIFGPAMEDLYSENNTTYCHYYAKDTVDIGEYDSLVKLYYSANPVPLHHNGQAYEIDMHQVAREIYKQYGSESYELDLYQVNENITLYLEDFSFDINTETEEITYYYFQGCALLKN